MVEVPWQSLIHFLGSSFNIDRENKQSVVSQARWTISTPWQDERPATQALNHFHEHWRWHSSQNGKHIQIAVSLMTCAVCLAAALVVTYACYVMLKVLPAQYISPTSRANMLFSVLMLQQSCTRSNHWESIQILSKSTKDKCLMQSYRLYFL